MKNFAKLFGIIAIPAVMAFSVVSCDNGTTSNNQTPFEGSWLVTETFQTNPPPGKPYDMTGWPPRIYKFSGDTYQVYYDGNLDEEGTFILYEDFPYKDENWYKNDPQYKDSSYMLFDRIRLNYNGYWLDFEKGSLPSSLDDLRIYSRFYRFIDQDTLYLFEGSSTLNLTLKRQK